MFLWTFCVERGFELYVMLLNLNLIQFNFKLNANPDFVFYLIKTMANYLLLIRAGAKPKVLNRNYNYLFFRLR